MASVLQTTHRPRCPSCQLMRINGVRCHEAGCPDAWRDQIRECLFCGTEFNPEVRSQTCCDEGCADAYYNRY